MTKPIRVVREGRLRGTTRVACLALGSTVFICGFVGLLALLLSCDVPCLFYDNFGVLCPGCGTTRAVRAFFSGRIYESFQCNPALLFAGILLVVSVQKQCLVGSVFWNRAKYVVACTALFYTVIRNLC